MKFGCICNLGGLILGLMEPRSDHPWDVTFDLMVVVASMMMMIMMTMLMLMIMMTMMMMTMMMTMFMMMQIVVVDIDTEEWRSDTAGSHIWLLRTTMFLTTMMIIKWKWWAKWGWFRKWGWRGSSWQRPSWPECPSGVGGDYYFGRKPPTFAPLRLLSWLLWWFSSLWRWW